MQVVMIGAGHMATVFTKVLLANKYTVVQVYSRTIASAELLAKEAGCGFTNSITAISTEADMYIMALADEAIEKVAEQLVLPNKLVIHTAGTISIQALANTSTNYGVLWPIKMIRKTLPDFGDITVAIDASNKIALDHIRAIASIITTDIIEANDTKRLHMHVAAALTTNFTNHLYSLAAAYCKKHSIDFALFYPLIENAAKAIQHVSPASLQAGPAFRGNMHTIEKHRTAIGDDAVLLELYNACTKSILDIYQAKK
jgi:predicted short-subunit dehydrogenase-like oxidoreductase (DUF2520 family)